MEAHPLPIEDHNVRETINAQHGLRRRKRRRRDHLDPIKADVEDVMVTRRKLRGTGQDYRGSGEF